MTHDESAPLNLDPILIPSLIVPVQTEGADGGVNYGMLYFHENGLLVQVQPYLNMVSGDWIEVFWGDGSTPVASDWVLDEHVGDNFDLFIRADRIPDGISDVWATVTRSGGGNGGESPPLAVLVRTVLPGGTDPEPDVPGHQRLPAPEPELPPSGIIDEEAAKNGVKVTIDGYPNMRVFDAITFSWGGVLLQREVTQDEVDAGSLEILVTEDVILEAGDSDDLVLVYRVRDEVHNPSSDWSLRTLVHVEVGKGLFDAPMIVNPDLEADPYDVIDLEVLGDEDLLVEVYAGQDGDFQVGDVVALKWVGTTAQGEDVIAEIPELTVPRLPTNLKFYVANADLIRLGRGRGVASYAVTRDDAAIGVSKRSFVTFLGEEQRLPKPTVIEAVDGVLDPTLVEATAVVPGDALEAGDTLILTWLGIRANGTPLHREISRWISGGNAGKPQSIPIAGAELIAPLDGGTLSVYYTVEKGSGLKLESEREQLIVGEIRAELPPPLTRPAAEGGVLDPEGLPTQLEIVVPPWPGMQDGQTLHVLWWASSGPHYDDFMPINPGLVGEEVVFYLPREHVEENLGADIEISYRVESPDGPDQISAIASFVIDSLDDIDSGPLRIMGARFNPRGHGGPTMPQILSALHEETLMPMLAAWRYEDSESWTVATEWFDDKPSLKLYVRSRSETWECRPLNVVGNGPHDFIGAFAAMRDEVGDGDDAVSDVVAWGDPELGGSLEPAQIDNVVEISATGHAFAARLRTGDVACWGNPDFGGKPVLVDGDFVQVRGSEETFVGRKRNGELYAWGGWNTDAVAPLPERIKEHQDYVDLCGGSFAFAALRETGHMVAWGDPEWGGKLRQGQERYTDIVQLMGNYGAFAALRDNGERKSVVSWGNERFGSVVPDGIARLTNVRRLAASTNASFCILLETGEVKAWPPETWGGTIPDDIADLKNVVEVASTIGAYCARLSTGKVVAWGPEDWGGVLPEDIGDLSNIVQVTGNSYAFAALCSDGSVVAWGGSGGDTSKVSSKLKDVRAIYAGNAAFTALTSDGRVVTWGDPDSGGDSSDVQDDLEGRVTARRLLSSSEAAVVAIPGRVVRRSRR
ncbi:RCC1 domain-containing protein [Pseudomonas japonica]|uniref:RCC1 domain-containing protein n=1 Tax=Pseudomonas japonica TaxID=256466 RepID=UPI00380568E5